MCLLSMHSIGAEEGCRGCIVWSNLCPPCATHWPLIPAHHTFPPGCTLQILDVLVIQWEMYPNSCWAPFISDSQTLPSVLLYHSISKSCISGHLLSRLDLDICTFLHGRPKVPESYVIVVAQENTWADSMSTRTAGSEERDKQGVS